MNRRRPDPAPLPVSAATLTTSTGPRMSSPKCRRLCRSLGYHAGTGQARRLDRGDQKSSGHQRLAPPASRQASIWESRSIMKAKIVITPKKAVLDPQGKSVQNALAHIGYTGVGAVHVGKYLEIELAGTDKEAARKQIDEACHKILSNPIIEDYRFEIE